MDTIQEELVAPATPACHTCGKTEADIHCKLMMCGRCKIAKYCSRECQANNWREHKYECVPAGERTIPAAPIVDNQVSTNNRFPSLTFTLY